MGLVEEIERLLRTAPPGTQLEVLRIVVPAMAEPRDPATPESDPGWSPAAIVEWVRREHGAYGLKLKQWAAMLPGVSHRELLRAADAGRLTWHIKPHGRDHGARMASPDSMADFLSAEGRLEPDAPGGATVP